MYGQKPSLWVWPHLVLQMAEWGESVLETPPHTLNAPQLICLLCRDFYPGLEVSHTWNLEGKPGPPVDTLASQPVSLDSRKRAQNQYILPRFVWDKTVFVGALVLLLGKGTD